MGGVGSGGARVGAGAKSKSATILNLHGGRDRKKAPPTAPPLGVASEPVAVPAGLPTKAVSVWEREAPLALAAATLTVGTADAFALHCRNVVLELKLSKGRTAGGPSHRGMIAAVTAGRLRFGISPNGKPIAVAKPAADPFAEFDEATG